MTQCVLKKSRNQFHTLKHRPIICEIDAIIKPHKTNNAKFQERQLERISRTTVNLCVENILLTVEEYDTFVKNDSRIFRKSVHPRNEF